MAANTHYCVDILFEIDCVDLNIRWRLGHILLYHNALLLLVLA